jgi:DNA-binding protein WhiA
MTTVVREELCRLPATTVGCRRAELVGVLRFAGVVHVDAGRVVVDVDLEGVGSVRRVRRAITDLFGCPTQVHLFGTPAGAAVPGWYRVRVGGEGAVFARRSGLLDARGRPVRGLPPPVVAAGAVEAAALWRGAFQVVGTLSEPNRSPGLVLTCPTMATAVAMVGAARKLGVAASTKPVRGGGGGERVLVRDPAVIGALLTRIGAPHAWALWEQRRLYRDAQEPTTAAGSGLAGFDEANEARAARAAAAAEARAERALAILGAEVPANLGAVGALRLAHRGVSLQELGRLADPPMSKDAVAGRLRRLCALADLKAAQTGVPDTAAALTPEVLEDP